MKTIIIGLATLTFLILIMVFTSYPDLFALNYVPHQADIFNVYQWNNSYSLLCSWVSAPYPPLYYYFIGIYLRLLTLINILPQAIFNSESCPVWSLILNQNFLFWAKFPYLIAHFGSAYFFAMCFQEKRKYWFFIWLLNPVSIFINFCVGHFDSIPIFFYILAFYFVQKKQLPKAFVSIGTAAAIKYYPFLILLPWIAILGKNTKSYLIFILLAITPYLLTIIPYLQNPTFYQILSFPENTKMLSYGFRFGTIRISYYLITYLVLLIHLLINRKNTFERLVQYSFIFSTLYFIFTPNWFVQRLLFLMPTLLFLSATNKGIKNILPIFYIIYFAYALINFGLFFNLSMLHPLIPSIRDISYPHPLIDNLAIMMTWVVRLLFGYIIYLVIKIIHLRKN